MSGKGCAVVDTTDAEAGAVLGSIYKQVGTGTELRLR